MNTNNMDNLFNLTNNPDVNNLIGNFVKVVNTNLEQSMKNVKKSDEDEDEEGKYFTQSRVSELDEEDEEDEEDEKEI